MSNCHSEFQQPVKTNQMEHKITIALAGQPNMGKSTIFNLLTGLNQHVGNWPGKTVEKKEGVFQYQEETIHLVDLPGIYSLTAHSPEEIITREYIINSKPDIVVAVVSAANLERSLYLVSELVTMPTPIVIALNMMDVAKQEGFEVDVPVLEAALGVPVVSLVATRAEGVKDLLAVVSEVLSGSRKTQVRVPGISADHRHVQEVLETIIIDSISATYPLTWTALKLLEGDSEISEMVRANIPLERWEMVLQTLKNHDDANLAIVSGRYEWIERIMRAAVHRPKLGQISLTDRLDRWATHPVWGLVILATVLGLIFWLTFTIGAPLQDWLDGSIVAPLGVVVSDWLVNAPFWLRGLVVDGLIGGVGSVLTFLPIIMIFFGAFGLLEDVGYMARAAFVMDNFMHWMGLHGKSFLPLFLGFGCNVPSIMGTRTIESWPARLLTILIAPLVPCTARMAVLAFITPAFFGAQAALVSWGLILATLALLILTGVILNRILFKGERNAFIMELPLYHIPNWRSAAMLILQRSIVFVKKAGTIILVLSVVIWALSILPTGELESSYLASIGNLFTPVGHWMGLDWRLTVALLTSFLAKENSIATLGVLFGSTEGLGLAQTLAATYSPAVALSFLTVSLLFIPCAATVAVIKQETGSWKWTLVNIILMLVLSIGAASGVYALATWLGL